MKMYFYYYCCCCCCCCYTKKVILQKKERCMNMYGHIFSSSSYVRPLAYVILLSYAYDAHAGCSLPRAYEIQF